MNSSVLQKRTLKNHTLMELKLAVLVPRKKSKEESLRMLTTIRLIPAMILKMNQFKGEDQDLEDTQVIAVHFLLQLVCL